MPIYSSAREGALEIRSVGDHPLEVGMAQIEQGMALAREMHEKHGHPIDLMLDLVESEEAKSSEEVAQIAAYFRAYCPPLSGRIAIAAPDDLLFGLSRVFSARAAPAGIIAEVFRSREEAWAWLQSDDRRDRAEGSA